MQSVKIKTNKCELKTCTLLAIKKNVYFHLNTLKINYVIF